MFNVLFDESDEDYISFKVDLQKTKTGLLKRLFHIYTTKYETMNTSSSASEQVEGVESSDRANLELLSYNHITASTHTVFL